MCCLFLNLRQRNADLSPIFCCFLFQLGAHEGFLIVRPEWCCWRKVQSDIYWIVTQVQYVLWKRNLYWVVDYVSECPEEKNIFLYVGIFYRWYEAHRDTFYIFILKWKDAYIAAIGFLLCVKASLSVFFPVLCVSLLSLSHSSVVPLLQSSLTLLS